MNKPIIFALLAIFAFYQYSNKSPDISSNSVSANSIDSACDAIVFTTASCPYCQQARLLLDKEKVQWCEFDINQFKSNYALYQEHGGNGVPLAIIGSIKLRGFNKAKYLSAIEKI